MEEKESARRAILRMARLEADSAACLAFSRLSRECLVSVGNFNQMIPDFLPEEQSEAAAEIPAKSVQAIRKRTLAFVLDEAFRMGNANPYAGSGANSQEPSSGNERIPAGMTWKEIEDLYRENLPAFVRLQGRMNFQVLASTDSGLIDSLSRIFTPRGGSTANADGGNASVPSPRKTAWKPLTISAREVPDAWIRLSGSLFPREWSPPIRMPYGYALLKINQRPPSIHEMFPHLIRMAYLHMNAPQRNWDSLALDSYQRNLSKYKVQDTLDVMARLLPPPDPLRLGSLSHPHSGDDSLLAALSAGFPMRALNCSDLPPGIQEAIAGATDIHSDPGPQPIFSEYGYWWIKVRKRKSGAGVLPFESVRGEILEKLKAEQWDTCLVAAGKDLASKRKDKASQLDQEAWLKAIAKEIRPEEITEVRARDSLASPRPEPEDRGPGGSDRGDEDGLKARIAALKFEALKQKWIAENIEVLIDM